MSAISFTISLISINKKASVAGGIIIFKSPFKYIAVTMKTIDKIKATVMFPSNGMRFKKGVYIIINGKLI